MVSPSYFPQLGGLEAHLEQLSNGLVALGCQVSVFTQVAHGDPTCGMSVDEHGVEIHRFADVTRSRRFEFAPGLVRELRRSATTFDIVHAHSFHGSPALVAAVVAAGQLVFTPHYHGVGHSTLARIAHLAYDPVASLIFRRASAVICVSEAEASLLRGDYGRTGFEAVVIPNGVDRDAITEAEPFPCARSVILVAGRLEPYKQVDRVIDAMRYLDPGMRLVVVGDGSASTDLKRHAERSGCSERVEFLGRIEVEEVRRWQRTAAVAVSFSRHEAYGLVLAEALSAGSPVVASDIPAHREVSVRAGGSVRLVPPEGTGRDVANAIEIAMTMSVTPSEAAGLLTWTEVAEQTLRLYRRCMPGALGT